MGLEQEVEVAFVGLLKFEVWKKRSRSCPFVFFTKVTVELRCQCLVALFRLAECLISVAQRNTPLMCAQRSPLCYVLDMEYFHPSNEVSRVVEIRL